MKTDTNRHENILTKILLVSGMLSSLWYVLINIYVPTRYQGYSTATQTVSELSAIDSPTRTLWVGLVMLYPVLFAAFGWGVIRTSQKRSLRSVGFMMIGYSIFNFY